MNIYIYIYIHICIYTQNKTAFLRPSLPRLPGEGQHLLLPQEHHDRGHIHVYIYIYMYMYIYIYIHIHMRICICVYLSLSLYIISLSLYTYIYIYIYKLYTGRNILCARAVEDRAQTIHAECRRLRARAQIDGLTRDLCVCIYLYTYIHIICFSNVITPF